MCDPKFITTSSHNITCFLERLSKIPQNKIKKKEYMIELEEKRKKINQKFMVVFTMGRVNPFLPWEKWHFHH